MAVHRFGVQEWAGGSFPVCSAIQVHLICLPKSLLGTILGRGERSTLAIPSCLHHSVPVTTWQTYRITELQNYWGCRSCPFRGVWQMYKITISMLKVSRTLLLPPTYF